MCFRRKSGARRPPVRALVFLVRHDLCLAALVDKVLASAR